MKNTKYYEDKVRDLKHRIIDDIKIFLKEQMQGNYDLRKPFIANVIDPDGGYSFPCVRLFIYKGKVYGDSFPKDGGVPLEDLTMESILRAHYECTKG